MAYCEWKHFVGSSLLTSGRYDAAGQKLQLCFVRGNVYEYSDVPQSFWWGLCQSESKGVFFNTHISSSFAFVQLSGSSAPPKVKSGGVKPRRHEPLEGPAPDAAIFDAVQNTHVSRIDLTASSRKYDSPVRDEVSEDDAHELIDAGDFLGAVSIYEQLEEEVRREGWGVHPSSEMICYFLYNQVVCLCWAGDYAWAVRRAGKLAEYADNSLEGINSYEFNHSAIDCWVVRRIRAFLDGEAPEPELRLAVGALRGFNDGVAKPVVPSETTQGRGCVMFLLAIPAGLAVLFI
jgi:hypothetical protein